MYQISIILLNTATSFVLEDFTTKEDAARLAEDMFLHTHALDVKVYFNNKEIYNCQTSTFTD